MLKYFILNKPYKVVSVFISAHRKKTTLGEIGIAFPPGTQAIGRLDENTEGLLILSTDKSLVEKILHPNQKIKKIYWVQVQGEVSEESMNKLRDGILIRIERKDYLTQPCEVTKMDTPTQISPRIKHPVSDHIHTNWLEITLTEGKFHQIRKMTAGIGHQTMRLIRVQIGNLKLEDLQTGHFREISEIELKKNLNLN